LVGRPSMSPRATVIRKLERDLHVVDQSLNTTVDIPLLKTPRD